MLAWSGELSKYLQEGVVDPYPPDQQDHSWDLPGSLGWVLTNIHWLDIQSGVSLYSNVIYTNNFQYNYTPAPTTTLGTCPTQCGSLQSIHTSSAEVFPTQWARPPSEVSNTPAGRSQYCRPKPGIIDMLEGGEHSWQLGSSGHQEVGLLHSHGLIFSRPAERYQ